MRGVGNVDSKAAQSSHTSHRLISLAFVLASAGCMQNLFYYPDSIVYDTPTRAGLVYEEVVFRSRDGTRLSGWFIPATGVASPRDAKGTVIHFHGNARNISAHWQLVGWLPARGFNLFVFDYRGYGTSEGKPGPKGVFEDSNSALDYIRSRPDVDAEKLIVLGQSLGGANAIAVVGSGNRAGVKAVAVEAAFYSYSSIAHDKLPGAGLFMDNTYSPERYIAKLAPTPLLLLHGTADWVIPYSHSSRLFAKAGEPKRLITIEGGGHTEALTRRFTATYQDALVVFFDAALSGRQ